MAANNDKRARRRKQAQRGRRAEYPSPHSYEQREGSRRGVLIGPSRYARPEGGQDHFTLDMLDLDADSPIQRIELGFFGHGFSFRPERPTEAVVFEKRGPGGCAVDLHARKVLAAIAPMEGHHFYGHGSFSSDGAVVFAVESHLDSGEGAISVRDGKTFELLDTFPTFGARPHDCHLIEGGKTLAITNGGGPVGSGQIPCVTFVATADRRLLEKHEVQGRAINTGHIALVSGRRDFAVVSAPREGMDEASSLGGVSLRAGKKPWRHMDAPAEITGQLWGESLSVVVHDKSGTVAATTPRGDLLTFWNLYAKALKKAVKLPDPRGVTLTLDGELFAIGYGPEASLALIDATTLEPLERDAGSHHFSGSHLYCWAHPA